jgi:hypothetical protein
LCCHAHAHAHAHAYALVRKARVDSMRIVKIDVEVVMI